jgi:hypothetical protein
MKFVGKWDGGDSEVVLFLFFHDVDADLDSIDFIAVENAFFARSVKHSH